VSVVSEAEAAEVLDALGADVRSRLANVRDGLRELQSLLSGAPGSSNGHAARTPTKRSVAASRSKVVTRGAARKVSTVAARRSRSGRSCAVQVTVRRSVENYIRTDTAAIT